MVLSSLLNKCLRGSLAPLLNHTRNVRPSIRVCREKFQLKLQVHQFKKDEIRVKAAPEYLIIEGKHERKTDRGFVIRQFYRKFRLPEGCDPETIESKLSPDGILTVVAPRRACGRGMACERLVPLDFTGPHEDKADDQFMKSEISDDNMNKPCK